MITGYVYVLHFDQSLCHAQHYAGCTTNLKQRLAAHAIGAGSNLCRVLRNEGITWHLGSLFTCCKADMRRLERSLKNQRNGPRFCATCTKPGLPERIPGTIPFPIENIPFPTDSVSILNDPQPTRLNPCLIRVRFTSELEPPRTLGFIRDLMSRDRDALGFIPAGGSEGLAITHDRGLIAVVSNNGDDVGYAAFTMPHDQMRVNIHQCCVRDDARLLGHGKALVEFLAERFPYASLHAKVRDDLAANHFWQSLGFDCIRSSRHRTSGNSINHYVRMPMIATA